MKIEKPRLADDWRAVLRYAWSIRWMALAGVLTGAEAVLSAFGPEWLPGPQWARMLAVFGVLAMAFVARIVAQKEFE